MRRIHRVAWEKTCVVGGTLDGQSLAPARRSASKQPLEPSSQSPAKRYCNGAWSTNTQRASPSACPYSSMSAQNPIAHQPSIHRVTIVARAAHPSPHTPVWSPWARNSQLHITAQPSDVPTPVTPSSSSACMKSRRSAASLATWAPHAGFSDSPCPRRSYANTRVLLASSCTHSNATADRLSRSDGLLARAGLRQTHPLFRRHPGHPLPFSRGHGMESTLNTVGASPLTLTETQR